MDFTADSIKARHSSYAYTNRSTPSADTKTFSKSDVNVNKPRVVNNLHEREFMSIKTSCGEYYKRYEHDELPVRDDSSNDNSYKEDRTSGGTKDSLTNSDLDKLEMKILSTTSQELQTEDISVKSLESNIKLFKITVQEIFDNFYTNLEDYEFYKRKYNEILSKNTEDNVIVEMEDFIKDMIENINSSNNSAGSSKTYTKDKSVSFDLPSEISPVYTIEAYRNQNYSTVSTFDGTSDDKSSSKKDETLNIYLLSGTPYVAIKLKNRSLLSEMYIRDSVANEIEGQLASAENIKKIAAKKLQLEKYVTQRRVQTNRDKDIPIKISCAKKDIPHNEDFVNSTQEEPKSLMSKICNYICKRFRKSSLS